MPRVTEVIKAHIWIDKEGQTFIWGIEWQDSFEEIKCRLVKPPVLLMRNTTGRFHLYSDTSKFATEVHYTKYRMANPSLSCMPVKDYKKLQNVNPLQN